jgi:hypothetical protein
MKANVTMLRAVVAGRLDAARGPLTVTPAYELQTGEQKRISRSVRHNTRSVVHPKMRADFLASAIKSTFLDEEETWTAA